MVLQERMTPCVITIRESMKRGVVQSPGANSSRSVAAGVHRLRESLTPGYATRNAQPTDQQQTRSAASDQQT